MSPLDFQTTAVLMLAAALGGALFGLGFAWRSLKAEADDLPIRRLARRAGGIEAARSWEVELRCMACAAQRHCRREIDAGRGAPEHCPNAELLTRVGTRRAIGA